MQTPRNVEGWLEVDSGLACLQGKASWNSLVPEEEGDKGTKVGGEIILFLSFS